MVDQIEQKPRITCVQLAEDIQKYDISRSSECIRQNLVGVMQTIKDIRFEPETRNSNTNKENRKEFAERLLNYKSDDSPILFTNETNFSLNISTTEGRLLKGKRCSTSSAASKRATNYRIGCIGTKGIIPHEIHQSSYSKEDVGNWKKEFLQKAYKIYEEPTIIVIDNDQYRFNSEKLLPDAELKSNHFLRMAPYSSIHNPIENV